MTTIAEISVQNFASGLLSEKLSGRYQLPAYSNGLSISLNGIIQTQGAWEYRPGFRRVHRTRNNQIANLLKFEFSDIQAYQLEFTHKKLRFYRDNSLILEDNDQVIINITNAAQAVVEITGHNYVTGEEVFIDNVGVMTRVGGRYWIVDVVDPNNFKIKDVDGLFLNSIELGAYTANSATATRVFEIDTPYREDLDLFDIRIAQIFDTAYLVHPFYEPRKLTRTDHDAWTLNTYTRTGLDPVLSSTTVTAITVASPPVVAAAGHPFVNEERVLLDDIGDTMGAFLNEQTYLVKNVIAGVSFELFDVVTGVAVDTSGLVFAAGTAFCSNQNLLPRTVSIYESRLWFSGAFGLPTKFTGSMAPQGPADAFPGDPRFDNFTLGTEPEDSVTFSLGDGEPNPIQWLTPTDRFLMAGTTGSVVKIQGDTASAAIAPDSIKAVPIDRDGVSKVQPINKLNRVILVQRGGLTLTTMQFDFAADAFSPKDESLLADHLTISGVKQMTWVKGRPDLIMMILNDGGLRGVTYKPGEAISAWHEHDTGATGEDKFLSVSSMPRGNSNEQLWAVTERQIDGKTRREVGYQEDQKRFPKRIDYFTATANQETDEARFLRAMAEAQKTYLHLDSAVTFDGSERTTETLTIADLSGNGKTFSSGGAGVFLASDVGLEIRKKSIDGVGQGRATIDTVTDANDVVVNIIEAFDDLDVMAAGDWYITAKTFINLEHLEGRKIGVVADGSPIENITVENATFTLPEDTSASVVHIGLQYRGIMQPMALEFGGVTGPAVAKDKVIDEIGVRFLWSLGAEFGTDLYKPEFIKFTAMPLQVGNPTPLFTGMKRIAYNDRSQSEKLVFIRQPFPLPLTVQTLVIFGETEETS